MDVLQGIASQNQRRRVLARWLGKPPVKADTLRLLTTGADAFQLAEWERAQVGPHTADEIEDLMSEHMQDLAEACPWELTFAVVWCTGTTALSTKRLNVRRPSSPDGADNDNSAEGVARGMSQSSDPAVIMAQFMREMMTHNTAHTKMYLTAHSSQVFAMVQVLDKLSERLVTSEERHDQSRQKHAELVTEVIQTLDTRPAEESDAPTELTPAQEKFYAMAERALPLLIGRFLAPPRPQAPPAAPKPPPSSPPDEAPAEAAADGGEAA